MVEKMKYSKLVYGKKIVFGVVIGGISMLTLTAILATMVMRGLIASDNIKYGIVAILLLSSASGSWKTKGKERGSFIEILGVGVCYFVLLLAITALAFGGEYNAVAVSAGVILTGCVAPLLLGKNRGNVGKTRRSKMSRR